MKIEVPWVVREPEAGLTQSGLDNALFGVKWRFLDEKTAGLSIATHPQVEFHTSRFSEEEGVEENVGLIIPLSFSKDFGAVSANLEIGHVLRRGEKPQWIYGLALGHEFSERLEVLAEIFGRAFGFLEFRPGLESRRPMEARKARDTPRLGWSRHLGHRAEQRTRLQSYIGVQMLF